MAKSNRIPLPVKPQTLTVQEAAEAFLERFWINRARRWQADLPGHVLSYKADLRGGMAPLPSAARVVAYHGQPRPWTSGDVYAAA